MALSREVKEIVERHNDKRVADLSKMVSSTLVTIDREQKNNYAEYVNDGGRLSYHQWLYIVSGGQQGYKALLPLWSEYHG